jgi:hypothetical protein
MEQKKNSKTPAYRTRTFRIYIHNVTLDDMTKLGKSLDHKSKRPRFIYEPKECFWRIVIDGNSIRLDFSVNYVGPQKLSTIRNNVSKNLGISNLIKIEPFVETDDDTSAYKDFKQDELNVWKQAGFRSGKFEIENWDFRSEELKLIKAYNETSLYLRAISKQNESVGIAENNNNEVPTNTSVKSISDVLHECVVCRERTAILRLDGDPNEATICDQCIQNDIEEESWTEDTDDEELEDEFKDDIKHLQIGTIVNQLIVNREIPAVVQPVEVRPVAVRGRVRCVRHFNDALLLPFFSKTMNGENYAGIETEINTELRLENQVQPLIEREFQGRHIRVPGGIIDVFNDRMLCEIKRWDSWKEAIGQIIAYSATFPGHKKHIHFFHDPPSINMIIYIYLVLKKENITMSYEGWEYNNK